MHLPPLSYTPYISHRTVYIHPPLSFTPYISHRTLQMVPIAEPVFEAWEGPEFILAVGCLTLKVWGGGGGSCLCGLLGGA